MIVSTWLAIPISATAVPELIFGPDRESALYMTILGAATAGSGWLAIRPWQKPEPLPGQVPAMDLTRKPATPPGIWVAKKQHRLPRPGSSVRQPMRQLNEAEYALAALLRQLSDSVLAGHVAEDTWRVATDTADRLRVIAARLESVEVAATHASPAEETALEQGAAELREHLDQGLDAYRGLIAAAGHVLLADAPTPITDELVEATERLAALAEALDELAD
ncbi:MAG TPA: hypothetical protein VF106_26915 [Actinophytocola sp.]